MANSPLDFFRRHKVLVMGTMLLAMILFVIGGSLEGIFSGRMFGGGGGGRIEGQRAPNDVVFTWSEGQVTERELAQMQQAHRTVASFMQLVTEETRKKGANPGAPGLPMSSDEGTVVQTLILAEKAKELGVTIDDQAVQDYLTNLSGFALSGAELNTLATKATQRRMSVTRLLDQIRHELLAQHMLSMLRTEYVDGAVSLPEAWNYFNRLNRRVAIEAYPIVVNDYLAKVSGAPTEAAKQEMFEKFKFYAPNPESPDPGFYRPAKMAFEYIKVDFAPFLEKAKTEITEDQIKAEYDLRVSRGEYKVPVKEEKEGETKPADGKPADDKGAAPKTEEKPAAGAEAKPAEPATDKPADPAAPAADPADPNAATDKADLPGNCAQAEPTIDAPPAEPAAPTTPPGTTPPAAETAPPAAGPADPNAPAAKPADAPAVEEKPADPAAKPADDKQPEMRIQTLEEVKEDVRTSLAQPIANDARMKALEAALKDVIKYGEKYYSHVEAKKAGEKVAELPPLDVDAIAKAHGFEAFKIPLVNRYEVTNYDLGKDGIIYRNLDPSQMRNIRSYSDLFQSFPDFAFASRLPEYDPQQVRSQSSPGDVNYIFWATEVKPAEQPEYADKDVQEALLAAWKKQQALELAKKAAEDLVAKGATAKSLADVVPEKDKIITPPPFSWFTPGSLPFGGQQPEVSSIPGIDLTSDEFMEPVTNAAVGSAVIGVDYPHAHVYVVKVLSQEPKESELLAQFYESGFSQPIQGMAQAHFYDDYMAKIKGIMDEYKLKWKRMPGEEGDNS